MKKEQTLTVYLFFIFCSFYESLSHFRNLHQLDVIRVFHGDNVRRFVINLVKVKSFI